MAAALALSSFHPSFLPSFSSCASIFQPTQFFFLSFPSFFPNYLLIFAFALSIPNFSPFISDQIVVHVAHTYISILISSTISHASHKHSVLPYIQIPHIRTYINIHPSTCSLVHCYPHTCTYAINKQSNARSVAVCSNLTVHPSPLTGTLSGRP